MLKCWNSELLFVKITKINIIQGNYQGELNSLIIPIPGLNATEMNILVWYFTWVSVYLALKKSAKNLKRWFRFWRHSFIKQFTNDLKAVSHLITMTFEVRYSKIFFQEKLVQSFQTILLFPVKWFRRLIYNPCRQGCLK